MDSVFKLYFKGKIKQFPITVWIQFLCTEICLRQITSQEVEVNILLFQCLLASYTIAPLKVLCYKTCPPSLLWCSLWILPDVYRLFSARQAALCRRPAKLTVGSVSSDGESLNFSTLFSQNHTYSGTRRISEHRKDSLSEFLCEVLWQRPHTQRTSPESGSAVGIRG